MKRTLIKRGDIYWVNFDPAKGTEVQKTRPALVCSCNIINEYSNRIIVAPITSNIKKKTCFNYLLDHDYVEGQAMLDQLRVVDQMRLGKKVGSLEMRQMQEIDEILKKVLGLV